MLNRDDYLAAWSRWHGDADTSSPLVRGWLTLAHTLARPLAGLPPVVATAAGTRRRRLRGAGRGRRAWLIAAGLLVGLSGLLDSLDGALAIGAGRASQRGFVLDSVVDRLTEVAYAGALWVAGAPGWLAVALRRAVLAARLRAGPRRAGRRGPRPAPISLWERPTRVAMAGFTLGGAGVVCGLGGGRRVVTAGARRSARSSARWPPSSSAGVPLRRRLGRTDAPSGDACPWRGGAAP